MFVLCDIGPFFSWDSSYILSLECLAHVGLSGSLIKCDISKKILNTWFRENLWLHVQCRPEQQLRARVSLVCFWAMAALLGYLTYTYSFNEVFKHYFAPWMVCNAWISIVTHLHHTHPGTSPPEMTKFSFKSLLAHPAIVPASKFCRCSVV